MMESNLISRRDLLRKSLKTAAAVGLGAIALNAIGDVSPLEPLSVRAMNNLTAEDLNFVAAEQCVLTCAATLGPCYYNTGLVRRDITEGKAGLPTRLGFRIVNADTCEPIQNASIDIWHTDSQGVYSAPISAFCNGNDPIVRTQFFARGIQTSNADGWAYFDTIYPGWYAGRVTHIHATIRVNNTNMVTTQFFFTDKTSEFIYRNHPNYLNRPNRDRTNLTDNVIGGNLNRVVPYLFTTRLVNNKYLQATKTIAIRTTPSSCNV